MERHPTAKITRMDGVKGGAYKIMADLRYQGMASNKSLAFDLECLPRTSQCTTISISGGVGGKLLSIWSKGAGSRPFRMNKSMIP
jgi:hypothetical protein